MRVVQEEIFGPVLVTTPFREAADLTDVARVANDTEYGLVATIWTQGSEPRPQPGSRAQGRDGVDQ